MAPSLRLLSLVCVGLAVSACKKSSEPAPSAPAPAPAAPAPVASEEEAPAVAPASPELEPESAPEPDLETENPWVFLEGMSCDEKLAMGPLQFIERYDKNDKTYDSVRRSFLVDEYVECYQEAMRPKLEALPAAERERVQRLRELLDSYTYLRFVLWARAAGGDTNIFRREMQDVALAQEELLRTLIEGLPKARANPARLGRADLEPLDARVRKARQVPEDIIEDPYGRFFREEEKKLGAEYARLRQELSRLPAPLAAPILQHLLELTRS